MAGYEYMGGKWVKLQDYGSHYGPAEKLSPDPQGVKRTVKSKRAMFMAYNDPPKGMRDFPKKGRRGRYAKLPKKKVGFGFSLIRDMW